jgi:hypothetical protein
MILNAMSSNPTTIRGLSLSTNPKLIENIPAITAIPVLIFFTDSDLVILLRIRINSV